MPLTLPVCAPSSVSSLQPIQMPSFSTFTDVGIHFGPILIIQDKSFHLSRSLNLTTSAKSLLPSKVSRITVRTFRGRPQYDPRIYKFQVRSHLIDMKAFMSVISHIPTELIIFSKHFKYLITTVPINNYGHDLKT